jgi:hypothetical protein
VLPRPRTNQGSGSNNAVAQSNVQIQKMIDKLQNPPKFKMPEIPGIPNLNLNPRIPYEKLTAKDFKMYEDKGFGNNNQGAGTKEMNKLLKSLKNSNGAYTSSLFNAAFQTRGVKVSRKQLNKLNEITYSGFENRPVLNLDLSSEHKANAKALRNVNF